MGSRLLSGWTTVQFDRGISGERCLVHLFAGLSISVAGLLLSLMWIRVILAFLCTVAVSIEGVRLWSPSVNRWVFRSLRVLFKDQEWSRPTGASYMAIGALAAFLVLPRDVAALSVLFLSVGDPVAALVGCRAPGLRVRGKSLVGSAAFMVVALLAGVIVAAGSHLDFGWPLAIGAGVAALAELLPDPVDDNLKIPLLSGIAIMFVS